MALNVTKFRLLSPGREIVALDFSYQLNGASNPPTTGATMVSGTLAEMGMLAVTRDSAGTHILTLDNPASEVVHVEAEVFPQSTGARNLRAKWTATGGPSGVSTITMETLSGTNTTPVDATDGRVHGIAWVRDREQGY